MKNSLFSMSLNREKGTALIVVVGVIFLISLGISAALSLETNRAYMKKRSKDQRQCILLADSGVEMAKYYVRQILPGSPVVGQLGPNIIFPPAPAVSGRIEFECVTAGTEPVVEIKAFYPDQDTRVSLGIRARITNNGTDFECENSNCAGFHFIP